jgi:oligopeptide transport system substrate-binding protein
MCRFALLVLFALLVFVPDSLRAAPKTAPFRFRLTADPSTLDWNLARSSYETYIIMNIMDGLVSEGADLKPQPGLADHWEISSDAKTYTFFLRPGVKWSDGKPLRAQDFVDSWIRLLDPKTHSSYADFLFDLENAKDFHEGKITTPASVGVHAVGDSTLKVSLWHTVPYFLHLPSFWVTFPIRADLIKKYANHWAEPENLATLGPYLLKEWKRGKFIKLTVNDQYSGRNPGTIREAEAVIQPDDQVARKLFETGAIDLLLNATTADLLAVKSGETSKPLRVEIFPYLATYYLGFNVKSAPLKDAAIRKAIANAVEREKIPGILQGGETAATSWVPPGISAGTEPSAQSSGKSLYDARGAFAKAGFTEGHGFPKLKLRVEKFDGAQILADALVKMLHDQLGIEVEAKIESSSDFQRVLKAGEEDLFVGHWGADFPDAANFFEVFSSTSGTNYTRWKSTEYDALLSQAASTLDAAKRKTDFAEAEGILVNREAVILPLFYKKNAVLIRSRVREMKISPLNYFFLSSVKLSDS